MKIALWTKPGTTQVRAYFNGVDQNTKIFAVPAGEGFEIKFSERLYSSQQDSLMNRVEIELEELNGGERVLRWEQIVALTK